ncbi:hypothetical protein E8E13_001040 [Curvularia kusanoi]|uniref:Uncharacterized protein n=1 Tax=Curvularia kusanoi TaxID=90978 RepID=A0A9P4W657_CURKU|nr:hypothetical protein E8E13_001040 [Curvularia kusanoi]
MVVQIFEPSLDLGGAFVLKLYDRRYYQREQNYQEREWSISRDMEFEKRRWSKEFVNFFQYMMASKNPFEDGEGFWSDSDEDEDDNDDGTNEVFDKAEASAYGELIFEFDCLRRYRAELEVYRRMREHGLDGKDVPRFIGSVRVPRVYSSKCCQTESSKIKGIPGILMQYVPGFAVMDLYDKQSLPASREDWKSIIDDCAKAVQYWMQNMEFHNQDNNMTRNSVVHWDPIGQRWKCKHIDFGNCKFKQEGMRRWEWRRMQSCPYEEGAVIHFMAHMLKEKKGFEYTYVESQYGAQLIRDFQGAFSTGKEPDGYES